MLRRSRRGSGELELRRPEVVEGGLMALSVVEDLDVVNQGSSQFGADLEADLAGGPGELGLERGPASRITCQRGGATVV